MSVVNYKTFDVVVVPFPYSDNLGKFKRRPAVIISKNPSFHEHTGKIIVAMITSSSAPWPQDVAIIDTTKAGLFVECCVRMKIFTLEQHHILQTIGTLGAKDQKNLLSSLKKTLVT